MLITCERCGERYDDADRNTICPHPLIMPRKDLEQKKLGIKLLGKRVRFAHMEEGPYFRVQAIGWNGMVELEGMSGEFAPHIFVVEAE
jgi:hypothetical protein